MKKPHIYALYRGDEFVDLGTKKYLANKLGVTEKSITHYTTKAYQERHPNGNCWYAFWIRDEEGEEK